MKKYIKLFRIHHYIKNILVLAPLACSGKLFEKNRLISCVIGIICFCILSSAIYVLNDIRDKDFDKNHPVKRKRPIASGEISTKDAYCIFAILTFLSITINMIFLDDYSVLCLIIYLLINILYSYGLKKIPLVDVAILSSGFLIRMIYGSLITGITVSNWLYLTVISLAFYLSLGKRRNELKSFSDTDVRHVLKKYTYSFLDKNMYLCLGLANVFYALWSLDSNTIAQYENDKMIFTVPIFLLISMKYSLDIEGDSDGDPVEVLIHDKGLGILVVFYIVIMAVLLYGF